MVAQMRVRKNVTKMSSAAEASEAATVAIGEPG
jgi:hypothetical protein